MLTFDPIIRARRSIRRYSLEKPGHDLIDDMPGSVPYASSPFHSEPVRFVLIESNAAKPDEPRRTV